MSRMPLRRALAAALVGVLAWGCHRSVGRVTSVRVSAGTHERALADAGVSPDLMRDVTREALREAGFRLSEGAEGWRARAELVSMQERVSPDGERIVEVIVDLRLTPEAREGLPISDVGEGRARLATPDRGAWREALAAAARQASSGLALALSAEKEPLEKLVQDLRSDDPRRREQALRVVGDRRSAAAVPALTALLRDPDPGVAERAAGALARIGDVRAVGPIIDYSLRLDDGRDIARYARIVGDIGGSEARGYLLTLESGHEDPYVRATAREALADMDARDAERARVSAEAPAESSRPGSR